VETALWKVEAGAAETTAPDRALAVDARAAHASTPAIALTRQNLGSMAAEFICPSSLALS
jgi:hypothetical protein